MKSLLIAPAIPAGLAAQQASAQQTSAQPSPTPPQPTPKPNTPARQEPRQPQNIAVLKTTPDDLAAATEPLFFTASQFATLQKLGSVLMPPLQGNPGALEAHAPEFLDFLVSASPADRQALYRQGLDGLDAQAQQKFHKPFAELDASQADAIVRPLLVVRLWPEDMPSDPAQNFLAQVHRDLRTATVNSREWSVAAAKSPHRFSRGGRGMGTYWKPIDPIYEG